LPFIILKILDNLQQAYITWSEQ